MGLEEAARAMERAVAAVLQDGLRTRDTQATGTTVLGTREMGVEIVKRI